METELHHQVSVLSQVGLEVSQLSMQTQHLHGTQLQALETTQILSQILTLGFLVAKDLWETTLLEVIQHQQTL
jgi:hypothetical protein